MKKNRFDETADAWKILTYAIDLSCLTPAQIEQQVDQLRAGLAIALGEDSDKVRGTRAGLLVIWKLFRAATVRRHGRRSNSDCERPEAADSVCSERRSFPNRSSDTGSVSAGSSTAARRRSRTVENHQLCSRCVDVFGPVGTNASEPPIPEAVSAVRKGIPFAGQASVLRETVSRLVEPEGLRFTSWTGQPSTKAEEGV